MFFEGICILFAFCMFFVVCLMVWGICVIVWWFLCFLGGFGMLFLLLFDCFLWSTLFIWICFFFGLVCLVSLVLFCSLLICRFASSECSSFGEESSLLWAFFKQVPLRCRILNDA